MARCIFLKQIHVLVAAYDNRVSRRCQDENFAGKKMSTLHAECRVFHDSMCVSRRRRDVSKAGAL